MIQYVPHACILCTYKPINASAKSNIARYIHSDQTARSSSDLVRGLVFVFSAVGQASTSASASASASTSTSTEFAKNEESDLGTRGKPKASELILPNAGRSRWEQLQALHFGFGWHSAQ
jgi:hypothetical protein